jgi:hypothetical protein
MRATSFWIVGGILLAIPFAHASASTFFYDFYNGSTLVASLSTTTAIPPVGVGISHTVLFPSVLSSCFLDTNMPFLVCNSIGLGLSVDLGFAFPASAGVYPVHTSFPGSGFPGINRLLIGGQATPITTLVLSTPGGSSPTDPVHPVITGTLQYEFDSAHSGLWYDPPVVYGYAFNMLTAGASFTQIMNFPSGPQFAGLTVHAAGVDYGPFANPAGFSLPAGISSFSITGINPRLDPNDPNFANEFPIQLAFSQEGVSFTMTALSASPEPSSFGLFCAGILALGIVRRKLSY